MMPDESDAAWAFAKEFTVWVAVGIGIGLAAFAALWEVVP